MPTLTITTFDAPWPNTRECNEVLWNDDYTGFVVCQERAGTEHDHSGGECKTRPTNRKEDALIRMGYKQEPEGNAYSDGAGNIIIRK